MSEEEVWEGWCAPKLGLASAGVSTSSCRLLELQVQCLHVLTLLVTLCDSGYGTRIGDKSREDLKNPRLWVVHW